MRVHSSIAKSQAYFLINQTTNSAKELIAEPPAMVELGLCPSERVGSLVGQACESLIEHFFFFFFERRRAALPRAELARRGCSVTLWNIFFWFFVFSFETIMLFFCCLAGLDFSDSSANLSVVKKDIGMFVRGALLDPLFLWMHHHWTWREVG